MFKRKYMSVLVVGFILAFGCGDLLAAEKGGNFPKIERLRGVSFDALSPAHNLLYMEKKGYLRQHQAFQAPIFAEFPYQTYLLRVTDVENKEQKGEKPPLDYGRVAGEILAGGVGGIAGGIAGLIIGSSFGEHGSDIGGAIGFFIGSSFGSAVGVYAIGTIGDETGSLLATFGGSILGMGIGLVTGIALNESAWASIPIFFGATIGATIGFNLTRRYDKPVASGKALINFNDAHMNLAVPTIYFRPNPFDGTLSRNVDLVRVRF